MDYLEVPFLKLDERAVVPEIAYDGDAGIDLRSLVNITLAPFERALVPTGLAVAIPSGYAGFVLPRSGSAIKQGLSLVNAPGLIDSGYRGELQCIVINLDANNPIDIHAGDRIAQLVVMKVEQVSALEVEELDSTTRGDGGFGSSGVS